MKKLLQWVLCKHIYKKQNVLLIEFITKSNKKHQFILNWVIEYLHFILLFLKRKFMLSCVLLCALR